MSDLESAGDNRRASFRIDDTVSLSIRVLDKESLEIISADFNAFRLRYCMKSHLQNQNEVKRPKLVRIKKTDPEIAEYLEGLENQIEQLAERLDYATAPSENAVEITGRVNLSSTGIRFRTHMPLVKGQTVEIGMVLSTQNSKVVMIGEVVRLESRPGNMLAASILYTNIHPEDTEAVIRHMAKLQQLELQGRHRIG